MDNSETRNATDLRHYLAVLSRRKWVIIPFAIVTPIVVFLLANGKTPVYEASADVLLSRQSQSLSGIDDPTVWQPERTVKTQAQLARVPEVARMVVQAAKLKDRGPFGFLGQSSVDAKGETDVMTFKVSDVDAALAARLATEYARQYIAYRRELDTAALRRASLALERQIDELRANGERGTTVYANLVDKQQQLETALTLQGSNALLVREASGAGQISPHPQRSAVLALVVALIVGVGFAFLLDTLDLRVRTADEISEQLGLPLLARLHEPAGSARDRGLVMLSAPTSAEAEGYRMLRTNLEFTNLDRKCVTILVTSALDAEGKSTTVANLAVALARAGRKVAVVDLDLRRPSLDGFFGIEQRPGITDLVLGRAGMQRVATRLSFDVDGTGKYAGTFVRTPTWATGENVSSANGAKDARFATLDVIPAGSIPPNPGEFVGSPALTTALAAIQAEADIVLIDGPPMLLAGDTLTLSAKIDGMLIVARKNVVRRPHVRELRRLLASSPAQKLGIVVTDDDRAETARGYYGSREREQPVAERTPVLTRQSAR